MIHHQHDKMKVFLVAALAVCVVNASTSTSAETEADYRCECDPCNGVTCTTEGQVCRIVGTDSSVPGSATCLSFPPSSDPIHWLTSGNPCNVGNPALDDNHRLIRCNGDASACPQGTDCVALSPTTTDAVCCASTADCEKEGTCPATTEGQCTKDSDCPGTHKCCTLDGCGDNRKCVPVVYAG